MTDNKNNIQDDEFRVIGRRPANPASTPSQAPKPDGKTGRRGVVGVVSLLIILAIGLLIYFNWPGGKKPLIIMSAFQLTAPGAADTGRIPSIMNSTAVPSAAAIRYFGRKMISTYISTNNIIAIFMYLYSLSE